MEESEESSKFVVQDGDIIWVGRYAWHWPERDQKKEAVTTVTSEKFELSKDASGAGEATVTALRKIEHGMMRGDVESLLGPEWKSWLVAERERGKHTRFHNEALPDYYIDVYFGGRGERRVAAPTTPEDPVLHYPEIHKYEWDAKE